MNMNENTRLFQILFISHIVIFIGILLILLVAFGWQIILYQLPCPLCLLQRIGFFCMAFGLLMNMRFGFRPSHYAIILISAMYTSLVALRQITLHILPGTDSPNSTIFHWHLYTWSFIAANIIIILTTLMLSLDQQYQTNIISSRLKLSKIFFVILILMIIINFVGVIFECGLGACPVIPTHYLLLAGH